jgi:hypothetical protein
MLERPPWHGSPIADAVRHRVRDLARSVGASRYSSKRKYKKSTTGFAGGNAFVSPAAT